ncbi:MAG: hypothetical protein BGO49_30990 [Planctomycetales bacterium 71-10]|nr:MAG: hypothetical protein BGO49_30990 [Planctomycetales bacterium 71-10]
MARTKRRASRPTADRLEGRIVLDASAWIAADGLLTIGIPAGDVMRLTIARDGGSYTFAADPADGDRIDLVANAAGLVATGSGTGELRASGISGIRVTVGSASNVNLISSDVSTTMVLATVGAQVTLGGGPGTLGLAAITAPVHVDASATSLAPGASTRLTLLDSESTATAYPTVTADPPAASKFTMTLDAIAATRGFGGLTYAGLTGADVVEVVAGTSAEFLVDDGHGRASMRLVGAPGQVSIFDVRASGGPIRIVPGTFADLVTVSAAGSTSGVAGDVTIGPDSPGEWRADVRVDDSAGAVARDARFAAGDDGPLRTADLSGALAGGARVRLVDGFTGELDYRAPAGPDNAMSVDLSGRTPFANDALIAMPDWPMPRPQGRLAYDGGSGAAGRLTIVGRPEGAGFMSERTFAEPAGRMSFSYFYAGAIGPGLTTEGTTGRAWIQASDVAEVVDLAPVDYLSFETTAAAPGAFLIRDGAVEGGYQTLRFESAAFPTVSAANKEHAQITDARLAPTLDYKAGAPVAGLSGLLLPWNVTRLSDPPGVGITVGPWYEDPPPPVLPEPEPVDPVPPEGAPPATEPTPPPAPPASGAEAAPAPAPDVLLLSIAGPRFGTAMRRGAAVAVDAARRAGSNPLAALRAERLAAFRAQRLARLAWLRASRGA